MAALGDGSWELFDLSVDRTEGSDLSAVYPDRVKAMNTLWEAWAVQMKVIENE
jgi:arylsulfatase